MCLRSRDNANDLSVWLQSWLVVVALDFRGEDPPSVWPSRQCSISWTGGLSSLPSRFRDSFHEAVATSAPFSKQLYIRLLSWTFPALHLLVEKEISFFFGLFTSSSIQAEWCVIERKAGHISHYLISPLQEEICFAAIYDIFAWLGARGPRVSKHRPKHCHACSG